MADAPETRDEDRAFDPSTQETNRSIDQGNGVGAREMDRQGSPTRTAEHDPFKEAQDRSDRETQDLPTPIGENDLA